MNNGIIRASDSDIYVKETTVHLSDEKLKGLLRKTYERAHEDTNCFDFGKVYPVFFTVAATLFLALLTSSFNEFCGLSSDKVTIAAWVICILAAVVGIVSAIYSVNKGVRSNAKKREEAVEDLFVSYISEE